MWATSAETTSTVHPLSQQQSRHEVSTAVYIYHHLYSTFLIMYWYISSNRVRLLCPWRVLKWLCHPCILFISRRYLSLILHFLHRVFTLWINFFNFQLRIHQYLLVLLHRLFKRFLHQHHSSPNPKTCCWFPKMYVHFQTNSILPFRIQWIKFHKFITIQCRFMWRHDLTGSMTTVSPMTTVWFQDHPLRVFLQQVS